MRLLLGAVWGESAPALPSPPCAPSHRLLGGELGWQTGLYCTSRDWAILHYERLGATALFITALLKTGHYCTTEDWALLHY